MSLQKDREPTDEELTIEMIKFEYKRLHIDLDTEGEIERRELLVDSSSIHDLLIHNLLHPTELQEKGPLTFDIGIEPEGTFVYASCWVTGKQFAKKPRFEIGEGTTLGEFMREEFRGSAEIVSKCKSFDKIPENLRKVVIVIELLGESLKPKKKKAQ